MKASYKTGDIKEVDKEEITFVCDSYLLVNIEFAYKIKEYLKNRNSK